LKESKSIGEYVTNLQKRAGGILKNVLEGTTEFQELNNFIQVNDGLLNCLLERYSANDEELKESESNFSIYFILFD